MPIIQFYQCIEAGYPCHNEKYLIRGLSRKFERWCLGEVGNLNLRKVKPKVKIYRKKTGSREARKLRIILN